MIVSFDLLEFFVVLIGEHLTAWLNFFDQSIPTEIAIAPSLLVRRIRNSWLY